MKCIICGIEVEKESGMYKNGIAGNIDAGYGSRHDLSIFHLRICDSCIDEKLKDGKLIKIGEMQLTSSIKSNIGEQYKDL